MALSPVLAKIIGLLLVERSFFRFVPYFPPEIIRKKLLSKESSLKD